MREFDSGGRLGHVDNLNHLLLGAASADTAINNLNAGAGGPLGHATALA